MTIFGKIINGDIPCNKVYEDEFTLAFHDIDPQAPIHIIVIPKRLDVMKFQDVDSQTIAQLTEAVQKIAKKLGLDRSGYRLITNNGYDAGQEVEHLHFHILGGTRLGHIHHKDSTKKSM